MCDWLHPYGYQHTALVPLLARSQCALRAQPQPPLSVFVLACPPLCGQLRAAELLRSAGLCTSIALCSVANAARASVKLGQALAQPCPGTHLIWPRAAHSSHLQTLSTLKLGQSGMYVSIGQRTTVPRPAGGWLAGPVGWVACPPRRFQPRAASRDMHTDTNSKDASLQAMLEAQKR